MTRKKEALAFDFLRDRQEQRLLEKYALLSAMEYFLLMKGNYLAISHLYGAMNLYDNEKLIRLMHAQGRGRSYLAGVLHLDPAAGPDPDGTDIFGQSGFEEGLAASMTGSRLRGGSSPVDPGQHSFASQIYEDILKLAAQEIVDKHNEDLRALAGYFMEGAVDEESDPDRVFLQYYVLFRYLHDQSEAESSYSFAKSLYTEMVHGTSGDQQRAPKAGPAP